MSRSNNRQNDLAVLCFQIGSGIWNVFDTLTDILVNVQYANKGWTTEAYVFLAILVANTIFQTFLGFHIESKLHYNRYFRNGYLDGVASALISLLQLRVLVETYFAGLAWKNCHQEASVETRRNEAHGEGRSDRTPQEQELYVRMQTRAGLALMQAIFRDVPLVVFQTWVSIQYNQFAVINVLSIVVSILAVSGSMGFYSCKEESTLVKVVASLYVLGQTCFRVACIIFFVKIHRNYALVFIAVLFVCAFIWGAVLGLGRKTDNVVERLIASAILSPMFTMFCVDTSGQDVDKGTARGSLVDEMIWGFTLWRFTENCVGVSLAIWVKSTQEIRFAVLSDVTMKIIGSAAAFLFVIGFLSLYILVRIEESDSSGLDISADPEEIQSPNHKDIDKPSKPSTVFRASSSYQSL